MAKKPTTKATRARTAAKQVRPAKAPRRPVKPATKAPKRAGREEQVLALLRRPQGVSIEELVAAFGVQSHTARAMVSVFGRRAGGVERREGRYHLKG